MINFLKKIYYNKYSEKSHSISGVDLIVDRFFSKVKNGIYIDIGCNHPIKYNNTYRLYKRGWKGINVDLDQKSIDEFNKFRPKDHNIKSLISKNNEDTKKIYFFHERSALNTIEKEILDHGNVKEEDIEIKYEKTKTINDIIEKSIFKNDKINFMSIDIENHEYEALKNFDFKRYSLDLIITECHDLSQKKAEIYNNNIDFIQSHKVYKLLNENNYKLINWVNSDLVFCRKDFNEKS